MKIGFVFTSSWLGAKDGYYVKVLELYEELSKRHDVLVTPCSFPKANIGYKNKWDLFAFSDRLDVILILASSFYSIKFTLSPFFRRKKIPIVWILEAPVEESLILPWFEGKNIFIRKLIMKLLAKRVDMCLCVSKEIEKYAKKDLGITNTVVLPNGANYKIFKKSRLRNTVLDTITNSFKVLWAGAGQFPWQGLDLVVSVARKLILRKDIVFIVITDQSWFTLPKDLNNLLVIHAVNHELLPRYLNSADVFLCLYKTNYKGHLYNSPMKLFEYMAMQKPIIASDLDQIREVIKNGQNGILTNNSPEDVAKKILYLKDSPKLSQRLSLNARRAVVKTYNWKNIVLKIEKEIRSIKSKKYTI